MVTSNIKEEHASDDVSAATDVLMDYLRNHENDVLITAEKGQLLVIAKGGAAKEIIALMSTMGPTPKLGDRA